MPSSSSSTDSRTSQTNTAINPIAFADNGGVSTNGVINGNGSIYNTVTTLDGQLATRALDNMLTMGQDALLFGSDAQRQAYKSNAATLDFAQTSNENTIKFANTQTKASAETAATAVKSAELSMTKALDFGAKQTAVALDSLTKSANMIDGAYKDAKGVLSTNVIMAGIGAGVLVMFFALRK